MPKGGSSSDLSILPPGYADDVSLTLVRNQDGGAIFSQRTISLLPQSAPSGAAGHETFPPEIRTIYTMTDWQLGVGEKNHVEGSRRAGLSEGVDTSFEGAAIPGPAPQYISDVEILTNNDFETWSSTTALGTWTKIGGGETTNRNGAIVYGGLYSAKVTSAGANQGIRQALTAANFSAMNMTFRVRVYVPTGQGNPTLQIDDGASGASATTTLKDQWVLLSATLRSTAALSTLNLDLQPATSNFCYFDWNPVADGPMFRVDSLRGPGQGFGEIGDNLHVNSEKCTYELNTATDLWVNKDIHPAVVNSEMLLYEDRYYLGLGGSTTWEHSTNGRSWTANGFSAGDQRYGHFFAQTLNSFGQPVLWKGLKPNKVSASAHPRTTGTWSEYTIGDSDHDITGMEVIENILYITKEEGVYTIDSAGIAHNITPWLAKSPMIHQGAGMRDFYNQMYIPIQDHALSVIEGNNLYSIGPAENGAVYQRYNGRPTAIAGADSFIYVFIQNAAETESSKSFILKGKRLAPNVYTWSDLGELDMGEVKDAWLSEVHGHADPRMYFSGTDIGSIDSARTQEAGGTGANTDAGGGATDIAWTTPEQTLVSDNVYATYTITEVGGTPESSTQVINTAGTAEQVDSAGPLVTSVIVKADDDNTGLIFIGDSAVSSTNGISLRPGNQIEIEDTDGIDLSQLWADTDTNGDRVDIFYQSWPTEDSDYLDVTGFDALALPSSATTTGFEVLVERKAVFGSAIGFARDLTVQLIVAGSAGGDNKAATSPGDEWAATDTVKAYGGIADKWSLTPTNTQLSASDFGVRIQTRAWRDGSTAAAMIDKVTIRIYYTGAAGDESEDNKVGYITIASSANPVGQGGSAYKFGTSQKLTSGWITRYPGWQTQWQQIDIVTSNDENVALGSGGREVEVFYDIDDGNGLVEMGGSGNGKVSVSPTGTIYFKQTGITSVVSERIKVQVILNTTDATMGCELQRVNVIGTVRPTSLDMFDFRVVLGDGVANRLGRQNTLKSEVVDALNAMKQPGWTTTLYDRDRVAHEVNMLPDEGFLREDILDYGNPQAVKTVESARIRCFVVPESENWT
jgi:hypothetical protein